MNSKILLVEDDNALSQVLQKYLEHKDYEVTIAHNGNDAFMLFSKKTFHLIISDLSMPLMNGHMLVRKIRKLNRAIPILVITHFSQIDNEILSYMNGVDLFHRKPVNYDLFLAQVEMLLNRQPQKNSTISKDFIYDSKSLTVKKQDKIIHLSPKEGIVLDTLLAYRGSIVSREYLVQVLATKGAISFPSAVDTLISRLRKRIGFHNNQPIIETIRTKGYRVNPLI